MLLTILSRLNLKQWSCWIWSFFLTRPRIELEFSASVPYVLYTFEAADFFHLRNTDSVWHFFWRCPAVRRNKNQAWNTELPATITSNILIFQSQLKDYNRDLEDLRVSRDELLISARESEKKAKHLEADLIQAQEDFSASERQRRAAEMERDELHDELSGGLKDRWEDDDVIEWWRHN